LINLQQEAWQDLIGLLQLFQMEHSGI